MGDQQTSPEHVRLDHRALLLARLTIARLGELSLNRWWRLDELLGGDGAWVTRRTLPLTHASGRARIATAVARHACSDRFPSPSAVHLFRLDPQAEDEHDHFLSRYLTDGSLWIGLMEQVQAITSGTAIEGALLQLELVTEDDVRTIKSLPLGPGGRSLPLPSPKHHSHALRLLAAGFLRSRPGELAVPYLTTEQLP